MQPSYLHNLKEFPELLRILEKDTGVLAQLIEKDYWIMHVLYGLQHQGFHFELKGGTSLSKGYGIINRFSEDIDIHIHPPKELNVNTNPASSKTNAIASRKGFYDWLSKEIKIDGIISVERDIQFDNPKTYNSGGIRLLYESHTEMIAGLKGGVLLEAGFDTVTPNNKITISSWAYDKASTTAGIDIIDNRAKDIACYHPGYTFVEKLQTIATKFRQEQEEGKINQNQMRQYYDIYCLLDNKQVQDFIGSDEYYAHKEARFPKKDKEIPITENQAFVLEDTSLRAEYKKRYEATQNLYYKGQPPFDELLKKIKVYIDKL